MNQNTRIQMTDNIAEMTAKLSDGNPGAIRVCVELAQDVPIIDPDAALGPFIALLSLDSLGIYGPRIWMLYKDVCRQSTLRTRAVLRAHQLGLVTEEAIRYAIDNEGLGIDVDDLLRQVQEALPRFGKGK